MTRTVSSEAALLQQMPDREVGCGNYVCKGHYLELSGTSMAAAMVSGTAIRMIGREPSLNPATVKARLMKSARKVVGTPIEVGAGVLDIRAALDATGYTDASPSPRLARSEAGNVILIQDTAITMGGDQWGAAYLWPDGYLWSDRVENDDPLLESDTEAMSCRTTTARVPWVAATSTAKHSLTAS